MPLPDEGLQKAIMMLMEHCLADLGFAAPLNVVSVGANRVLTAIRVLIDADGAVNVEGLVDPDTNAEMALPITLLICDRAGRNITRSVVGPHDLPTRN